MSDTKNMKLFSLSSNHEIAQKIADAAGVHLGNYLLVNSLMVKSKLTLKKVYVDMMFTSFSLLLIPLAII